MTSYCFLFFREMTTLLFRGSAATPPPPFAGGHPIRCNRSRRHTIRVCLSSMGLWQIFVYLSLSLLSWMFTVKQGFFLAYAIPFAYFSSKVGGKRWNGFMLLPWLSLRAGNPAPSRNNTDSMIWGVESSPPGILHGKQKSSRFHLQVRGV